MATAKKQTKPVKKAVKTTVIKKQPNKFVRVLLAPFVYVKGAWFELRQVRWPNRRASWSLTFAVIVFSVFFAAVIVALDFAFNYLFKEILL